MELDPSRWLVSLAGFAYDWIITREWKQIFISMIPLGILVTVASLVWSGSQMDRQKLSAWYLELGEKEIADWESSWAPTASDVVHSGASADATSDSSPNTDAAEAAPTQAKAEVSRFGEVLFRRAQLLQPSNQSQFVIGATLAQRGAFEQALTVLSKIAPNEGTGFAKAHAYLTMIYMEQYKAKPSLETLELLKHHSASSEGWDRTPDIVLAAGSDIFWSLAAQNSPIPGVPARGKDRDTSLRLLTLAAERNPNRLLELAKRAAIAESNLVYADAAEKAEAHFKQRLDENGKDDVARVMLAELYLLHNMKGILWKSDGLDRAEQLLLQREKFESSPLITRALSEVYRLRFRNSFSEIDGKFSAKLELLDQAMRLDPTNPRIAEEVASMMKDGDVAINDDLINALQEFLAGGKATTATHALLSEAYLVRAALSDHDQNFKKALGHLEQVVNRQPNHSQCLNNMAFVIADLYPERLEESLEFARRSVESASRNPRADYYDTLGTIYAKLNRAPEAITAYEIAIELEPRRIDFHERVAEQYRSAGNEEMATNHENFIGKLREQKQAVEQENATLEAETSPPQSDAESSAASPQD